MRTAGRWRSSAGIGLISRVSCHVDVAAPLRRERVDDRCTSSAMAMITAITTERYASDE